MIVNGVTLPDIPEEVLASYPYVLIVKQTITAPGFSMIGYSGIASTSPFAVLPPNMSEYIEPPYEGYDPGAEYRFCFTEHSGVKIDWSEEDSSETWTINEIVKDYGDFGVWAADCTGPFFSEDATMTNETVWANHDICVATGIVEDCLAIAGTEVYFANSATPAEPSPTRYSIAKAILDAVAKQIMRLTDSTAKVKPEEFEAKLESVEKGTALPDNARVYYVGSAESTLEVSLLNFESITIGEVTE